MMGATLAIDCDNGTAPVDITITDYGFPNYGSGTACDRNGVGSDLLVIESQHTILQVSVS